MSSLSRRLDLISNVTGLFLNPRMMKEVMRADRVLQKRRARGGAGGLDLSYNLLGVDEQELQKKILVGD